MPNKVFNASNNVVASQIASLQPILLNVKWIMKATKPVSYLIILDTQIFFQVQLQVTKVDTLGSPEGKMWSISGQPNVIPVTEW